MNLIPSLLGNVLLLLTATAWADSVIIPMSTTSSTPTSVGSITALDTDYGLLLTPNLHGLPAGMHGFHVHQTPSCADKGQAAGSHYDPLQTKHHAGPFNAKGHAGDLPFLSIDQAGKDSLPILAPRLTVAELRGHALIIHAGGDNYADKPQPLGGGGARIACGVIPKS